MFNLDNFITASINAYEHNTDFDYDVVTSSLLFALCTRAASQAEQLKLLRKGIEDVFTGFTRLNDLDPSDTHPEYATKVHFGTASLMQGFLSIMQAKDAALIARNKECELLECVDWDDDVDPIGLLQAA